MNVDELRAWVAAHKAATVAAVGGTMLVALYLWHRHKVAAAAGSASDQQQASSTPGTAGGTVPGGGQYLVPYDGTADYSGSGTASDGLSGAATLQGSLDALNNTLAALNGQVTLPGGAPVGPPIGPLLPGGSTGALPGMPTNTGPTTGSTTGTGAHTGSTSKPGGATTTAKKHAPTATKKPAPKHGKTTAKTTAKKSYTVRRGDTLTAIARREHISLSALEKLNPQIKNPNVIRVGEKITV